MKQYNNIELNIYKAVGVPLFRKAVMIFERVRHLKDSGKNVNYHIRGGGCTAVKRFCAFLSYNAFLHIMSVFFIVLYVLAGNIIKIRGSYTVYFFIFLFFVNIYCIMLQRWNSIHMTFLLKHMLKQKDKRVSKLSEKFSEMISEEYLIPERKADLEVLLKLHNSINYAAECPLTREDYDCINRMSKYFFRENKRYIFPTKKQPLEEKKICEIFDFRNKNRNIYTKAEKRVKTLQYIFRKKNTVLNERCVIVTESNVQDTAFRRLFPNVNIDSVEVTLEALIAALSRT